MNKLEINVRHRQSKNLPVITLEFKGVLDESTVGAWETFWNQQPFKSLPRTRLLLDFRQISHISPFGMGFLKGVLDHIGDSRDLRILHMPRTIRQAFARIQPALSGFHFYDEEQKALHEEPEPGQAAGFYHFNIEAENQEVISGLPFTLRVEMRDGQDRMVTDYAGSAHMTADIGMISPTLLQGFENGVWSGSTILTGPGPVKIRIWNEVAAGEAVLKVVEKGERVNFPVEILCPGCQRAHIIGKTDIFRCVHCNQIYFVDLHGRVVPLKPGNHTGFVKEVEFKIPSDINYLNHVRNFIVGISREANIDEEKITQIEMSLDEALANVVEHAYSFDCHQEIQVNVSLFIDRLLIVIKDHGRSFDPDKIPLPNIKEHIEKRRVGGLGRYLMQTLMDEVEYHSDEYTNELRMLKRF